MKQILIFVIFIQIIQSRLHRVAVNDEIYRYAGDESIPSYLEYFSVEHVLMEQIDDGALQLGGYGLCIKSLDPTLPLQLAVRSQYLEHSIWREGPVRLLVPNLCPEFLNPSRFWYNFTKLWTNCPPKVGEKWLITDQILNVLFNKPPSFSNGPWRGYMLLTQGLFGATTKFGAMIQLELFESK